MIKSKINEESGYLLLEGLVTLSVIVTILLVLYPLIVDWLLLRETEKEDVEYARTLYEASMQWPERLPNSGSQGYFIQMTDAKLIISKNNKKIGVDIYEVEFD